MNGGICSTNTLMLVKKKNRRRKTLIDTGLGVGGVGGLFLLLFLFWFSGMAKVSFVMELNNEPPRKKKLTSEQLITNIHNTTIQSYCFPFAPLTLSSLQIHLPF